MIILIQCANKFIKLVVSDCSGDIAVNVIRVHEIIKLPFILKYSLLVIYM